MTLDRRRDGHADSIMTGEGMDGWKRSIACVAAGWLLQDLQLARVTHKHRQCLRVCSGARWGDGRVLRDKGRTEGGQLLRGETQMDLSIARAGTVGDVVAPGDGQVCKQGLIPHNSDFGGACQHRCRGQLSERLAWAEPHIVRKRHESAVGGEQREVLRLAAQRSPF